ncbi:MAG: hypothetical protein H8E32_11040 [Nitrospinae bacterium]|nr:hypothetical protein [Nitrospinota bacterium]
MMDWNICKPDDFSMEVDVENIQEIGQRQMFPVRVFYKDGTLAFYKSIPLRSEFYLQLRGRKDWKEKLMVILNQRIKEEIGERIHSRQMGMDDKLEFIGSVRNAIV